MDSVDQNEVQEFPDWIKILKDITLDPNYKSINLAKINK